MKLNLSPEVSLKELKSAFSKEYPYLKLEFFSQIHSIGQGNSIYYKINDRVTLKELTGLKEAGQVDMDSRQKVFELEQIFQNQFHLPVQVFRKTRYGWLETTQTDQLTLRMQNKMGREACNAIYDSEILL